MIRIIAYFNTRVEEIINKFEQVRYDGDNRMEFLTSNGSLNMDIGVVENIFQTLGKILSSKER